MAKTKFKRLILFCSLASSLSVFFFNSVDSNLIEYDQSRGNCRGQYDGKMAWGVRYEVDGDLKNLGKMPCQSFNQMNLYQETLKSDLFGTEILNATFSETIVKGSLWSGVHLIQASADGIQFHKMNLHRVQLHQMSARGSQWENSKLNFLDMVSTDLSESKWNMIQYRGQLENITAKNAKIYRSQFNDVMFKNTNYSGAEFVQSDFKNIRLCGFVDFSKTRFSNSPWKNVVVSTGPDCKKTELSFKGADLRGNQLQLLSYTEQVDLSEADLRGSDLSEVRIFDFKVNLTGAKYNAKTKFPKGVDISKLKMTLMK